MNSRPSWPKIRHVLEDGKAASHYAIYALLSAPWAKVVPLLYFALVTRDSEDEIMGYVVDGASIVPADDPEDPNMVFHGYYTPTGTDEASVRADYDRVFQAAQHHGYNLASQQAPQGPAPQQFVAPAEQFTAHLQNVEQPARRRRNTGSGPV